VAKTRQHRQHHGGRRGAAGKPVRIGEEITFERRGLRIKVADGGRLLRDAQERFRRNAHLLMQDARHIEAVRALRDDHRVQVDIALHEFSVNLDGTQRPVEEVFAGLDGVARTAQPVAEKKGPAVRQHAAVEQQGGYLGSLGARLEQENQIPGIAAIGAIQLSAGPGEAHQQQSGKRDQEPLPHGSSLETCRRAVSLAW